MCWIVPDCLTDLMFRENTAGDPRALSWRASESHSAEVTGGPHTVAPDTASSDAAGVCVCVLFVAKENYFNMFTFCRLYTDCKCYIVTVADDILKLYF